MNDLTVFNYGETEIRTVEKDGELWWVLVDVCKVLELTNSRKAASQLDEDEKGVTKSYTLGGKQNMTIINEPGLYSLILRSNKPEAKAFKRWVTHEVLPTIRRKGVYQTEPDKREIAELIVSCKNSAAVKGILSLYDIQPSTKVFHIPQNASNSVSLFLEDDSSSILGTVTSKEVYETYKIFCKDNNLVPSTLTNFSKEIHKQTGLIVKRYRVNGILTGFYTNE